VPRIFRGSDAPTEESLVRVSPVREMGAATKETLVRRDAPSEAMFTYKLTPITLRIRGDIGVFL